MPELSIELIDDEILDAGDGIHIPRSWVAVVTGIPDVPGACVRTSCTTRRCGGQRLSRSEWIGAARAMR